MSIKKIWFCIRSNNGIRSITSISYKVLKSLYILLITKLSKQILSYLIWTYTILNESIQLQITFAF